MTKEDYKALECGCFVFGGKVTVWCGYHFDNQPKENDALDQYLKENEKK